MLKILYVNRPDSMTKKGGDFFTMLETMKYVEKNGFNVSYLLDYPPKEKINVDLIHIFNLETAEFTYKWIKYAKENKIPVILSTIYWKINPFREKKILNIFKLDKWARKEFLRSFFTPFEKFEKKYIIQKKILEETDFLITYTYSEKYLLQKKFNVNIDSKTEVIHHGIDEDKFPEISNENGNRNLILHIGAIGPRKNQIATIKATLNLNYPVYFIGRIEDIEYFNYCKKISSKNKNIFFISEITYSDVIKFFKRAKVHVLPSWKDIIPRVNLEASAMGCNIVTTTESYEREIYEDDVWYCKPYDIKNLKRFIIEAYNSPVNLNLVQKIRNEYTRKKAVEKLINFYLKVKERFKG
ncbi:MAG: glycosyltransferase family 4 protein [Candidatus Ratteibacteria bacterium]